MRLCYRKAPVLNVEVAIMSSGSSTEQEQPVQVRTTSELVQRQDVIPREIYNVINSEEGLKDPLLFNDPYWPMQWELYNQGQFGSPKRFDLNIMPVWKRNITGKGVVVTIIDDVVGGVRYNHSLMGHNLTCVLQKIATDKESYNAKSIIIKKYDQCFYLSHKTVVEKKGFVLNLQQGWGTGKGRLQFSDSFAVKCMVDQS
ncbi:UNVERIFIED_CONTAM: hypothetical protein FKN15_069563 [Acipenser sinensis]